MSALDAVLKLKGFITSSLKYSSVGFVILIPIAVVLSYFGFIKQETTILITEITLFFGLAEAILNAVLNKIKKEKVEFAEIKTQIEVQNFEALAKYKKEGQFSETALKEITSLISQILTKKVVDTETLEQAEKVAEAIKDDSVIEPLEPLNEPVEFKR